MKYIVNGRETIYTKKKEVDEPGWEGEWDRVQRMRRERHPLIRGGNFRDTRGLRALFGAHATKGVASSRRAFKKPPYAPRN